MFPIYARLDGKSFSKFTKGMKKPFDDSFYEMMHEVTKVLIEETDAKLGYFQSDEISLYWDNKKTSQEDMMFKGRKEKWVGELSSLATSVITQQCMEKFPDRVHHLPRFDCRVMNVLDDVGAKFFLWRQLDCIKNSISVISSSQFSHKKLQNVSTKKRREMLHNIGDPWEKYPGAYRLGTFMTKVKRLMEIDKSHIPIEYHHKVPDEAIRNVIESYVYPYLQNIDNVADVLNHERMKQYNIEKIENI
ncbi:hypothetical protein PBI_SCTP2_418 [Salicola phage SCTP-2]|nr:hypothetical protein PBI_SCTP2_418 [Salicola phage SCTP-2]